MQTTKQTETTLLDKLVKLMDTAIKIPGTNIRFGLDAIIGLIPGLGDSASFIISGGLMLMMAKKGINTQLVMQMLGNVAVDYLIGAIPLLGDLFDVGFKANQRNLDLLKKYQAKYAKEDIKTPNLAWIFFLIISVTTLFILLAGYLSIKIGAFVLGLF